MIRIITDSASDIVDNNREDLVILPMTIAFSGEEFQDGVNLTHRMFYEKLVESEVLPVTSQITPFSFRKAYKEATDQGDRVIVITLSSKLSGTWQSAKVAAEDYGDMVYVVDSENAAIGERTLVEYALCLKDEGLSYEEIIEKLEKDKKRIRLIALLDTLEYLKKGGRISATVAFAGGLLSIKPVIAVQNGEVVILGKARGAKQGKRLLTEQIKVTGGIDFTKPYVLGYTGLTDEALQKYIADNAEWLEGEMENLPIGSVGGTIGTHVGPGAIGAAFFAAGE